MADLQSPAQRALQIDSPELPGQLHNLGLSLYNRYLSTGAMSDLEEAIQMAQKAVDTTPLDHPDRAGRLNNLGAYLSDRFEWTEAISDLDLAICIGQQVVDATPLDHPEMPPRLNNLASGLESRYKRTGAMPDLTNAIHIAQQVLDQTPSGHPNRATYLTNLGLSLRQRHLRTGSMPDLEDAIRIAQEAVETAPLDHPDMARCLNNLGLHLHHKYAQTDEMSDLNNAVNMARQATDSTPLNDLDRPGWLGNLAMYLRERYLRTGATSDIEEAISIVQQAIDATPLGRIDQVGFLDILGLCLSNRHARTGAISDLEDSIRIAQQAVDATAEGDPGRAARLNILGTCLEDRYKRTGTIADLTNAIHIAEQALNETPLDHPERAGYLINLALYLGVRFEQTGKVSDLESAIRIAQEAMDTSSLPPNHPYKARILNNLAGLLLDRYEGTGNMSHLDEAIHIAQIAVKAIPPDSPDHDKPLINLSICLNNRYKRTGQLSNLKEAICLAQRVINSTPLDHPQRAVRLIRLGEYLADRYIRTGAISDIEDASSMTQQAVDATPPDHSEYALRLKSLAIHQWGRYWRTKTKVHLEEAISTSRKAIDGTPLDHPDRPHRLNILGLCLDERYSLTGAMSDLEDAIRMAEEAVNNTPQDHPDRPIWLKNLGSFLRHRYEQTGVASDLENSQQSFLFALHQRTAVISCRVDAGRHLLSSPEILRDLNLAYSISKTTIEMIPLLAFRSLQNSDKRHLLSAVVGLSCDAAAIALSSQESLVAAIEFLETGRGVIAVSIFERLETHELEKEHPELAHTLNALRDKPDPPSSRVSFDIAQYSGTNVQLDDDQHHKYSLQAASILEKIRLKPGFERFLLSSTESDMLEAASPGPIVIINVSSHRCDALIIQNFSIRLLELPLLSRANLDVWAEKLQSLEVLEWLWDIVVHPILNALGFTEPSQNGRWSRMWWVPTGILSRFPLHAAGYHFQRSGRTTLDRVISSYSSSIRAIVHRRQQKLQKHSELRDLPAATIVTMQHTPKQGSLKFAAVETNTVRDICESMRIPCIQPRPCKADILSALETCWIFHFAGHGQTNPVEPLHSQLLLEDWEEEPLTVESLLETNLTAKSPFLAYLSACGTSQISDERSVDESLHLASAYQLAGFRHVVGTLWSVDDELSVDMARITYEFLRDNGLSDESVSHGLHHATRMLRDQWIESERDASSGRPRDLIRRDVEMDYVESPQKRPHWIPYVHYGS